MWYIRILGGEQMEKATGDGLFERFQWKSDVERDPRRRAFLSPVRVVWERSQGGCLVENAAALLTDAPMQASLCPGEECVLANQGQAPAILLDFGRELHGGIEITVDSVIGAEEAILRVRFGESATEAMSDVGGPTNATNDHARRDFTVTLRRLSMNPVGETGFRFARIDLLSEGVTISLRAVRAILLYLDIPYLGSFRCSDPLLNDIWGTGAYTVHLNMQRCIWDGIKRDRLVWIGDMHPEVSTILAVFGDQEIIRKSLDMVAAETPDGKWMNGIPSYSMWWIIIQYDYFLHTGNRAYLEAQLPYLKQLCGMLSACIDGDGRDITPGNRFIDWPTVGHPEAVDAGLQALHAMAAERAGYIFDLFHREAEAEQCRRDLERLVRPNITGFKQADALAALAGLQDARAINEASLRPGGAEGMTCFMGYYILLARAMAGDAAGALDAIRTYWGGMLKLGATTFWEDFDIAWMKNAAPIDRLPLRGERDVHGTYGRHCYKGHRHSLCHGWASGPTSWLTKTVLGIEVIEPGCRKIRVRPELCGLDWAEGAFPTPLGVLRVAHRRDVDGNVRSDIDAPEGIEVLRESAT